MRCYGFNELSTLLQHHVLGKTEGGLLDLLFDYDRERQTLRWWRVGASGAHPGASKGTIPIPFDLLAEAERVLGGSAAPGKLEQSQQVESLALRPGPRRVE